MENFKRTDFKHIVSLGYFCSIAQDLEKLGLRDRSYPFDWCITNFEKNIELINNHFDNLLNEEFLSQSEEIPHHYKNELYDFYFFHDFNDTEPLSEQLITVKTKYDRRIKAFYETIEQPTLFIRYISPQDIDSSGNSTELKYIENSKNDILQTLKQFNEKNEIIYISNDNLMSDKIKLYHVSKDTGDIVARSPLYKQKQLFDYFSRLNFPNREENLNFFLNKKKSNNGLISKINRKISKLYKKHYQHSKRYKE